MAVPTDLHLGACEVYIKESAGDWTRIHTLDGVSLSLEPQFAELRNDANGLTPVDYVVVASPKVSVSLNMDELTYTALSFAMPMYTETSGVAGYYLTIGQDVGDRLTKYAVELLLRPYGATDDSKSWYFYKALPKAAITLDYNWNNQSVINVVYDAVPDTDNGNATAVFAPEYNSGLTLPSI